MNATRFALPVLIALVTGTPAFASTVGLPGTAGTTSSTWDTFPAVSFSNDAPDTQTGPLFSANLTSAFAGGMVLGGNDRLYSGAGATPNATNLTLNGTASGILTSLSLVIKFTAPSQASAVDFYSIALDGVNAGTPLLLGSTAEGSGFLVYQWTWTGLTLTNGSNFGITVGSAPNHVSIDAIQLSNVAAVPEPGSLALLAAGIGGFVMRRSRPRRA